MLLINNVNVPLECTFSKKEIAKYSKLNEKDIISFKLYKKSVDARRDVCFCCSFLVEVKNEQAILRRNKNASVYKKTEYEWKKCKSDVRPVVVGFGPCGMFCALTLARAGLKPIVLERGRDVDRRMEDVNRFWNGEALNPESNVQFGEGGAGTFSDGKLNTGIKDVRCRVVLEQFVSFGAGDKILIDAKPHIGTDILVGVVKNIRKEIIALGGEVRFESRLDRVFVKDGAIYKIAVNGEEMPCECLCLATGHSARDTFSMLRDAGFEMERKSFAMGARIEHRQSDINRALYGESANHPALSAADYKLVTHLENERAVYTFCMCPGGVVVNASSEEKMLAVNGMSYSARDGENANSALLVEVKPTDLAGGDVLEGVRLQREIEKRAYSVKDGAVPICYVGDITGEEILDPVAPTVKPDTVRCDINAVLPDFIADSIKEALPLFEKRIRGFSDANAVLTFPETRSSSPVRLKRDKDYEALGIAGVYPAGEGAGYAGGIMSAAVDGMRVAEAIIEKNGM